MKLNISLLAILTAALVTPSLSLAHDPGHNQGHPKSHSAHHIQVKIYPTHAYANHYVNAKHHQKVIYLDRKDYRIDRYRDCKHHHDHQKYHG